MNRFVSFHPLAAEELREGANFYDLAGTGLGDTSVNQVERAIEEIQSLPEAAPLTAPGVRRKSIGRFPYSVVYRIVVGEVRMLAIAHQKRRPFYWWGRR